MPWRRDPAAPSRERAWRWLRRRWEATLPEAELVVGTDRGTPFSKAEAVNDAYRKATGDLLVIADADSWMEQSPLRKGMAYAEAQGCLVVPWVKAHRLMQKDSEALMRLDPREPNPVTRRMREETTEYRPSASTAAMVICVSREGFERVGGFDARFRGWGGEDVAFGLACGTLLGETKIMLGEAFALWHERGRTREGKRVWHGDDADHNAKLSDRYWVAAGYPDRMARLCAEHPLEGASTPIAPSARAGRRPSHLLVPEFREALYHGHRDGERIQL